jgi:hypothetical protein
MIIQTIRLDPSEPNATDDPSHLSRADRSEADQIDAGQATDLVIGFLAGCDLPDEIGHTGAGSSTAAGMAMGAVVDGSAAGCPAGRYRVSA